MLTERNLNVIINHDDVKVRQHMAKVGDKMKEESCNWVQGTNIFILEKGSQETIFVIDNSRNNDVNNFV